MARIRSIKPDFFLHEGLAELSPLHRLFFVGLWTLADKEGRLEDRPKRIKAALMPWERCDVEKLLTDLSAGGFIVRYSIGDLDCIAIPNFAKHQRPHPKESTYDLPPPPEPGKNTASREIKRQEIKTPTPIPSSPPFSGGGGGGGDGYLEVEVEAGLRPVAPASDPQRAMSALPLAFDPQPTRRLEDKAQAVFDHWCRVMAKRGNVVFGADRRRAVEARLKEGFEVEDLCRAVDGCSVTPHNIGQNDRGERFDDLELICRNSAHVERFKQNAEAPPKPGRAPIDTRKGHMRAEDADWSNGGGWDEANKKDTA